MKIILTVHWDLQLGVVIIWTVGLVGLAALQAIREAPCCCDVIPLSCRETPSRVLPLRCGCQRSRQQMHQGAIPAACGSLSAGRGEERVGKGRGGRGEGGGQNNGRTSMALNTGSETLQRSSA